MRPIRFQNLVLPLEPVAEMSGAVRSRLEEQGFEFGEDGYVDGLGPAQYLHLELDAQTQVSFEYLVEASFIVFYAQPTEETPALQLELARRELHIPDEEIGSTYKRW